MTLPPDDEYGELLRRALRAEADSVVPSPEGLEIIRARIARGGLRGLFWWRAGASLAGAVLLAGTVVMLIPDLRTQVVESTGISSVGDSGELPDTSSIQRPPVPLPPRVIPTTSPPRGRLSPAPSHRTGATARPSPSRSDPCPSPGATAGVVEPEPTASPSCPPQDEAAQQSTVATPSLTSAPAASPAAPVTPAAGVTPTPAQEVTPNSAESPAS